MVAPFAAGGFDLVRLRAPRQLLFGNQQRQFAPADAEADTVTALHVSQRAAHRRFGRNVQHDGAGGGSAHASVGDAHDVLHAGTAELFRDRQVPCFGHAGRALRSDVFQHQNIVGVHVERIVIDALRHVLDVLEHHGAPLVLHQLRVGRRLLDDRPARREIAAQHRDTAARIDRRGQRPNYLLLEPRP